DVDALGERTGADALDVVGHPLGVEPRGGYPLDQPVAMVDVVDKQTVSAVVQIVPDSRHRYVQPALMACGRAREVCPDSATGLDDQHQNREREHESESHGRLLIDRRPRKLL